MGQLRGLRAVDRQLDVWQREAIARARHEGASWSEIGEALGVTKQAAWQLYNDDVPEMLGEVRERSGLSDEEAQQLADAERSSGSVRVVIDPDVLVSAAVASGVSAELDRWLTDSPFDLVVRPTLVDELRNVLGRDRFRRWISAEEAERFVGRLEDEALRWDDPAAVLPVTADPSHSGPRRASDLAFRQPNSRRWPCMTRSESRTRCSR